MFKITRQFLNFLGQVRAELKRVKWPSNKEIRNLTVMVIIAIIIIGIYISLLDVTLTKFIELGIK